MIFQDPVTMATIVGNVTQIVTASVGWIGSYVNCITDTPLLLFFVVMSAVGLGVGLIRRMIRL